VDLSRHGVTLEPGQRYEWSVVLLGRDGERLAEPDISVGFLEYRPPDRALEAELAGAAAGGAVFTYARRGLWYEAFDDAQRRLTRDPADEAARLQAAALLEQVGLAPVAEDARRGPKR
jgi:hypothetical protein